VITSGGIGPTEDDLTREIIAEVTGRGAVLDHPYCNRSSGFASVVSS
jgi:molybdopterin-biosynthesis enzyme MoeA-like protein